MRFVWAVVNSRWTPYIASFAVALYGFWVSEEARDQFCLSAENEHLRDVKQLRQTYAYLAQLRPGERDDSINRFVIERLPETERKARQDTAPEHCDHGSLFHGDLGRPEPDPVVPKRPASLR